MKTSLLPIRINEKNMEPTVIEKANQFVFYKVFDAQLLDIMKFIGRTTNLDSFVKAYKTSETKSFFLYEWLDCPQKMNESELPPYEAFFRKLRKVNPLEKDCSDYQKLLAADWRLKEHYLKWNFPNHRLQEKETINICLI